MGKLMAMAVLIFSMCVAGGVTFVESTGWRIAFGIFALFLLNVIPKM